MPYKKTEKQKEYQAKHYQKYKSIYRERYKLKRRKRKIWFLEVTKGIKCLICECSERICLDFHHLNPKEKVSTVTQMVDSMFSKEKVSEEVKKCVVLCANCHRKLHAKLVTLPHHQ